jgi:hypothetical protein
MEVPMDRVAEAVRNLALDRPTATVIVVEDPAERHFVAEALVTAAALFLLQHYAAGFLRGVGLDAQAEKHGRRCAELFAKLRARSVDEQVLKSAAEATDDAIAAVREQQDVNPKALAAAEHAETAIIGLLGDMGVGQLSATKLANRARIAATGRDEGT